MVKKNHPFTSHPAEKHPKQSKFAITDIREKPVNFFYCSSRASTLVSAITLLTQVPLQKFPFLFIFTIPWLYQHNGDHIIVIYIGPALSSKQTL